MIRFVSGLLELIIQVSVVLVLVLVTITVVIALQQGYELKVVLLTGGLLFLSLGWTFGMAAVLIEVRDRLDKIAQIAESYRPKQGALGTTQISPVPVTQPPISPSRAENEFEDRWNILKRYDPDIQAAVEDLAQLGGSAVNQLKQAYKALGNTSNLAHVTEVIKKEFEEEDVKYNEYNIKKYDDLSKLMDGAFQDELKLKKVLDLIGLRLVKKATWTDVVEVSSNEQLGSAFNEAQLRGLLKSLAAKQFGVVDDEASEV